MNKKIDTKSKIIIFVHEYEKIDNKLTLKDKHIVHCCRKDIEECMENTDVGVEYITSKPETFRMGVLYILKTPSGRPDYIYTYQLNG